MYGSQPELIQPEQKQVALSLDEMQQIFQLFQQYQKTSGRDFKNKLRTLREQDRLSSVVVLYDNDEDAITQFEKFLELSNMELLNNIVEAQGWDLELIEFLQKKLSFLKILDLEKFQKILSKLFILPFPINRDIAKDFNVDMEDLSTDMIVRVYGQDGILDQILKLKSRTVDLNWSKVLEQVCIEVSNTEVKETAPLSIYLKNFLLKCHAYANRIAFQSCQYVENVENVMYQVVIENASLRDPVLNYVISMLSQPHIVSIENKQNLLWQMTYYCQIMRSTKTVSSKIWLFMQKLIESGANPDCTMFGTDLSCRSFARTHEIPFAIRCFDKGLEMRQAVEEERDKMKKEQTVATWMTAIGLVLHGNRTNCILPTYTRVNSSVRAENPSLFDESSIRQLDLEVYN